MNPPETSEEMESTKLGSSSSKLVGDEVPVADVNAVNAPRQITRPVDSTEPHITIKRGDSSWNGWCVNYNGLVKPTCRAGVAYGSVQTFAPHTYSYDDEANRYRKDHAHPCFKHEHGLTNGCAHCRFPTPEEIKAHREEMTKSISNMMKARTAIIKHIDDARGVSGVMDCPVCETGKLQYSRAQYNGHVHARCSTPNCVAWME